MKSRTSRLNAIREIIRENTIPNQEVLQQHLHKRGFPVTQATLSRDLRYLQVGKVADGSSTVYYSLPDAQQQKESEQKFLQDIRRGFISIDFSHNLGVLKTLPGHANSVAFAMDNLEIPGMLGSIAGDDTILIVLEETQTDELFLDHLKTMIPELELVP
jgi:transcriptional regulator of arginine metabolism